MNKPLAYRMRPKTIDNIVGQTHLVGKQKIIWRMTKAKQLSSMILYGPPGIGKTSIASAIAGSTQYAFRMLNAATDKKKDLEIVVEEAKMSGTVILLLDEVHRLDKPKQDFLLPHLENGRIVLIGATTENPYISIHPAIRSRAQIFELKPLTSENIKDALNRAINDEENGLGTLPLIIKDNVLDYFARATQGDLRSALNALELAAKSTEANADGSIVITKDIAEECLQKKSLSHDKDGDAHYNTISAFQKSIRGSDVHAALHYLARLIEAGELKVIIRRLIVTAYEDIGLSNPAGVARVVTATEAAEKIGFPEARIPLSNAVIEMCLSPKSNSAISAIDKALQDVRNGFSGSVPDHLKDAHYKGAEQLGSGVNYRYPHNHENHWVKQQYLPDNLKNKTYYEPLSTSKFENALSNQLAKYNNK
ncbi:MAG: replication-associated recombination protein A [Alkalibacterium sp.]|uniref:Replication-associated recombination protein A n=1 Tax=Alkalibacterium gilvum TaxID=1130080 RepID=A0A1H6UJ27_9LACT|nr:MULTISPECIES: replication-associated recombination protein A [Alkalibacterium]MDN6194587.1 replication-associated recombination protein A [Alkalibacterium sp.]MDN6293207.1 replication-associated recombination protein A [Alkalibacterium sp.]MDN6295478.1 replication-associated recombination protein A [Alkalibacterium sp.]MDN6398716.1 replication-associated recombination protein A [Alkalibacterium sp.]SEI87802.1 putative ATPase [Alkalibacterium gilvum]